MDDQLCVIIKRGYYYRAQSQGYTANFAESGKYRADTADQHAANVKGVSLRRLACDCGKPARHEGHDGSVVCSDCLSQI